MAGFRFKQFNIEQDDCAMKVSTDGILLGAWSTAETAETILDIGSGTGLLSLMLAQKSAAHITAVEIDSDAAKQSKKNIANSPWPNRIDVHHSAVQQVPDKLIDFDVIISNPPYYSAGQKFDAKRQLARHDSTLNLAALVAECDKRLAVKGKIFLILPCQQAEKLLILAEQYHFYLHRRLKVRARADKKAYCQLLELSRESAVQVVEEQLTIYNESSQYSDEFKSLCRDYYLNF